MKKVATNLGWGNASIREQSLGVLIQSKPFRMEGGSGSRSPREVRTDI